jgi:hypothetical protein
VKSPYVLINELITIRNNLGGYSKMNENSDVAENNGMIAADTGTPRHSDECWRKFQLAFRNYAMPKSFVS